ncbi:uncharacterized protein [Montipora foliosa]|uniref:uncharacterized protein n=1 Tax=Montipora foliosa TaxID=591990 RepID=UPI0035F1D82A
MADKPSKLKAQIAFLTDLIKSHKQTMQVTAGPSHATLSQRKIKNKSRSFAWQRKKPSGTEQQLVGGTSSHQTQNQTVREKSSYSLDRRIITTKDTPHKSGLNPVSAVKSNQLVPNKNTSTKQNQALLLPPSKPAVSLRTEALSSHVVFPKNSPNATSLPSSSQISFAQTVKNPYVLNKKVSSSLLSENIFAKKLESTWSKQAAASSAVIADDSKSHSDSELYTKKSSLLNKGKSSSTFFSKGKSATLTHQVRKSNHLSNVGGSFKWSKHMGTVSGNPAKQKALTKSKPTHSKLKWTKAGYGGQPQSKGQKNLYVLKKGNLKRRNSSVMPKTVSSQKLAKCALYSSPGKSLHVWRAAGTLKLDRRNMQTTTQSTNKKTSSRRSSAGFIERRQKAVLRDTPVVMCTRYSIVRSKRKEVPIKAQELNKVVVIGGVPYKTSSNKLRKTKSSAKKQRKGKMASLSKSRKIGKLSKTVTIEGEKFAMDAKGKTLLRVTTGPRQTSSNETSSSRQSGVLVGRRRSSNGRRIILHTPTTLVKSKISNSHSKTLASRVLRRSIHNARLHRKNKGKLPSEQYCMFYNRFGKCNKQDTCPYIHDPSKVAVCTKFLRGRCKNTDGSCPFSHKIDRDKMPVCQFFLRGKCSNDNCPYSHVNVGKKAEVCEDFLKGFCSRGQECNKKHILECEEFAGTGKCSKGSKCKLMHRTRKSTSSSKRKPTSKEELSEESSKLPKLDFTNDEGFLPLAARASDSDANVTTEESVETKPEEAKEKSEPLVIRPRFLKTKEETK